MLAATEVLTDEAKQMIQQHYEDLHLNVQPDDKSTDLLVSVLGKSQVPKEEHKLIDTSGKRVSG